jgi:hypothetical protein
MLTAALLCAVCCTTAPCCRNWAKNLPFNRDKTRRLQAEYDKQLLPILLKRLDEMGITVPQEEQQRLLSGAYNSSSPAGGGKCPIPGVHSVSSDSSSSSTSGSSEAQCPVASAAATEAAMLDSKDILSLAVRLSQQEGGVDLAVLMSQMKTFFAAGGLVCTICAGNVQMTLAALLGAGRAASIHLLSCLALSCFLSLTKTALSHKAACFAACPQAMTPLPAWLPGRCGT